MSYEDTVRVADLKIRASRFARVRAEAQVEDGQILEIAEFFHPRTQEIADTLPAGLGRWLMHSGWARALVDRATRKGQVVKTTSVSGFALLYLLSKLRPWRRRSLRFAVERTALETWLDLVAHTARTDYAPPAGGAMRTGQGLRRYPRTRARQVRQAGGAAARLRERNDSATLLEGLIKAAVADEGGQALDKAIAELDGMPAPTTSRATAAAPQVS